MAFKGAEVFGGGGDKVIKLILSTALCVTALLCQTDAGYCEENAEITENHSEYEFVINNNTVGFDADEIERYDEIVASQWQDFPIYDSSELSLWDFENRNGRKIIERVFALVTSPSGKAKQLGGGEWFIDYESYTDSRIFEGTVMLSYFVYNPDSNFCDDYLQRYDFVLSREYED